MNILKSIGGSDFVSILNNVMSKLLTNYLAISYSFIGKQKKKSFKDELPTHLRLIISKFKKNCCFNDCRCFSEYFSCI